MLRACTVLPSQLQACSQFVLPLLAVSAPCCSSSSSAILVHTMHQALPAAAHRHVGTQAKRSPRPQSWLQPSQLHTIPASCSTSTTTIRLITMTPAQAAPSNKQPEPGMPAPGTSEVMANLQREAAGLQGQDEASCIKVTLPCIPGHSTELLGDALLGVGATSVVVVEHRPPGAPEQEIYEEPGSGAAGVWDKCDLIVYLPLEANVRQCVEAALEIVDMSLPQAFDEANIEAVANRQWVDQIKASYQPLQLSSRLYIVPEWSEPTDPNALNIILQPGVAFGTGEHPTTRMCLAALEGMEADVQGAHVMDYGTGSGVLALAALLLGAESAVGTDTDPLAVKSAIRNAELTGVGAGKFAAFLCKPHIDDEEPLAQAAYPRQQFELVMANILRGPLLELQPRLTAYCKPGGLLILSGILSEQVPDVRAVYEPHFQEVTVHTDASSSWACVVARRRA